MYHTYGITPSPFQVICSCDRIIISVISIFFQVINPEFYILPDFVASGFGFVWPKRKVEKSLPGLHPYRMIKHEKNHVITYANTDYVQKWLDFGVVLIKRQEKPWQSEIWIVVLFLFC